MDGRYYIFINKSQSPEQQWQDFCHELSPGILTRISSLVVLDYGMSL
ncbi:MULTISPECIES: ImmA/IrrE family metallo-endopeptidase [Lysinibacillus]